MKKTELIKRLEDAYGCLIGSRTDNTTAENQFKNIIEDLKYDKQITSCPKCDSDKPKCNLDGVSNLLFCGACENETIHNIYMNGDLKCTKCDWLAKQ